MPLGAGKYDDEVTQIREKIKADGVILLVFGGIKGSGFSVQAPLDIVLTIPGMLRFMADEIESSTH